MLFYLKNMIKIQKQVDEIIYVYVIMPSKRFLSTLFFRYTSYAKNINHFGHLTFQALIIRTLPQILEDPS